MFLYAPRPSLRLVAAFLAVTRPAPSETLRYDPVSFPDDQGWTRVPVVHIADRWLEPGWFVQSPEIWTQGPPQQGEQDFYRWELASFAGIPAFQMAWVVESDGPQQGIPAVAPASIVAGGQSGIRFHFTIARDQVRLIDSYLDVFYWDISLGSHAYRVEVEDGFLMFWIDDQRVHQNIVPGPYPTSDSSITFGARAAIEDSTTRWAWIEFGSIPPDADPDDDGDVDLIDFSGFHQCASASSPEGPLPTGCAMLDADEDGDVDFVDFANLQLLFTGGDNQ